MAPSTVYMLGSGAECHACGRQVDAKGCLPRYGLWTDSHWHGETLEVTAHRRQIAFLRPPPRPSIGTGVLCSVGARSPCLPLLGGGGGGASCSLPGAGRGSGCLPLSLCLTPSLCGPVRMAGTPRIVFSPPSVPLPLPSCPPLPQDLSHCQYLCLHRFHPPDGLFHTLNAPAGSGLPPPLHHADSLIYDGLAGGPPALPPEQGWWWQGQP